jgi:hypothetical protein
MGPELHKILNIYLLHVRENKRLMMNVLKCKRLSPSEMSNFVTSRESRPSCLAVLAEPEIPADRSTNTYGQRIHQALNGANTTTELCPPNPNEFEIPAFM